MTNDIVKITFHLSIDNSDYQLFVVNDENPWKVYGSGIERDEIQIFYGQEKKWEYEINKDNIVSGVLNPKESLFLGDISGGSSINHDDIKGRFNMDYLKLSHQNDSIVIVNDYVRKSFLYYDKEYRIQIDDKR